MRKEMVIRMEIHELMSAIKERNDSDALQMDVLEKAGLPKELSELINRLTGICGRLSNDNVKEMKRWMSKKEEAVSEAEALEKMLKSYEEDEAERIVIQESLANMQENIEKRSNASERYEAFSGIRYIEETGALIEQYGERVAKFNKLNDHLNDDRAEYHRYKAKYFYLLGDVESFRAEIDRLQHMDAEKGDMTLTLECMISVLRELADVLAPVHSAQGGNESSIEIADLLKQFSQLVLMLEVKLRDYAPVLPEKFMEEIKKIL